jgi:hypothetical protein
MTRDPVSDVADVEESFLRFVQARDLRLPFWRRSGDPVALGTRSAAADGEREVVWRRVAGTAIVHSFCIYHRQYHPDFPPPYNVAIIQLDEGHLIVSTIVADAAALRVGLAVSARFEPSGRLIFVPKEGFSA